MSFKTAVLRTPFTTQAANEYFKNKIIGEQIENDLTFLSTMRALLYDRIEDGKTQALRYFRTQYNESQVRSLLGSEWAAVIKDRNTYADTLSVISISSSSGTGAEIMYNAIDNYFEDGDWKRVKTVTDFFVKAFPVLCFVNEKKRSSVFFVQRMDMEKMHLLQVGILNALPWLFNPKNGDRLSKDQYELLQSLQEKNYDHYIECLTRIAGPLKFEETYLREKMRDLETEYERKREQEIQLTLRANYQQISDYQNAMNEVYRTIDDLNTQLFGLQEKIRNSSGESVLLSYFLGSKSLKIVEINGTVIRYYANTYLNDVNIDIAERMIDNKSSIIYTNASGYAKDIAESIVRAVLIDRTVRLRMCGAFYIDIRGGFDGLDGFNFAENASDRMPNPHIQQFRCLGDYRRDINDAVLHRNFIKAIDLTISSAGCLNLSDPTVANRFFRDLFSDYTTPWFELPDGTPANLKDVVKYIENKEADKK